MTELFPYLENANLGKFCVILQSVLLSQSKTEGWIVTVL